MARYPYASQRWKQVRRYVLNRDRDTCQIGLPGCTVTAQCVDHVVPWRDGGAAYDVANLRAACTHCNIKMRNIAQTERKRRFAINNEQNANTNARTPIQPRRPHSRRW
jgi:5-methylcytosine-specific restriction endonuclease McrA